MIVCSLKLAEKLKLFVVVLAYGSQDSRNLHFTVRGDRKREVWRKRKRERERMGEGDERRKR